MRKNDPIKNIMSDTVHSVQQGQPISEVFKILHNHKIHHVPVLDGKNLVGIVSSTDLMQLSMGAQGYDSNQMWAFIDSQYQLVDVMTGDPRTLNDSDAVRDAAQALSSGSYHSLPIINSERHLVGMVTSTDLIRYLCEQY
jgi:CBS-domain-containing membrane protein